MNNAMKQQSALEFIITYSWALIIIALFVASVFVLSGYKAPSYYLSSSCYITSLLECEQSILTYNAIAPLKFALVFKNALGTAMLIPQNGINVTVTNIGLASTNNYVGNCYPTFVPSGAEALCNIDIPGGIKPGVGTQVTIPFTLNYKLCSGPDSKICNGASYKTTGTATQLVAPSSITIYSLAMNSSTGGAYIVVSGISYPVNSTAFFVSNKYTIYAKPPIGYAFSSWSISSLGSFLSSTTSQTTTLTLSSNATIIANFVVSTSTTSTSSSTSTTATTTSTTSTSTSTTSTSTSTTSTSTSTTSTSTSTTSTSTSTTSTTTLTTTAFYACNSCGPIKTGYSCPSSCSASIGPCGGNNYYQECVSTTTSTTSTSTSTTKSTSTSVLSSFVGSTKVLLANGAWIPIQYVKPGYVVMSYNTNTSQLYPNIVVAAPVYSSNTIYTINNNVSTDGFEVFYVKVNNTETWVHASDLKVGEEIYNPLAKKFITIKSITVTPYSSSIPVYDIVGSEGNDFVVNGGYLADKQAA